jgi:hypothetical protein
VKLEKMHFGYKYSSKKFKFLLEEKKNKNDVCVFFSWLEHGLPDVFFGM